MPTSTPPPYSATVEGATRTRMPTARSSSANSSTGSLPKRRASQGATSAPSPRKSTGTEVTRLLAVDDRPNDWLISLTSGDTLASAARMFTDASTIPTSSTTGCASSARRAATPWGEGRTSASASGNSSRSASGRDKTSTFLRRRLRMTSIEGRASDSDR